MQLVDYVNSGHRAVLADKQMKNLVNYVNYLVVNGVVLTQSDISNFFIFSIFNSKTLENANEQLSSDTFNKIVHLNGL